MSSARPATVRIPDPLNRHSAQRERGTQTVQKQGGSILEPQRVEPAAAPGPGPDDGVDERGQHQREQEKGPQLDPFGQGAGHDRGGGRHEDHLEEPIGHHRIAVSHHGLGRFLLARQQGGLRRRRTVWTCWPA